MEGIIDQINNENLKSDVPQFNIGDTVKVFVKGIEGAKERFRRSKGSLSPNVTAVSAKPLP